MIDKNKIKEMTSRVLHPQKSTDIDNKIMHVEREWFFGVFLGIVVVVIGAVWSWSSYQEYRSVDTLKSSGANDSFVYREELIKEVLKDFEQREEIYKALLDEALDNQSVILMPTSSFEPNSSSSEQGNVEDVSEAGYINPEINNGQDPRDANVIDLNF